MKTRTPALAIPILAMGYFLTGCSTSMEPSTPATVQATLNEPFKLVPGQTAVFEAEHLTLTFNGVSEDSRCPVDIVCVQAGEAILSMRAEKDGEAAMTLAVRLGGPQDVVYQGYGIHVQRLLPDQRMGRVINPADYVASVLVDRP